MRRLALLALLLAVSGCAVTGAGPPVSPQPRGWREAVTDRDRDRLRDWRQAWVKALQRAERAGHGPEIAREGALLQPDAALGGGPIPNGDYRCRVIKVGARSAGLLEYIAYPAFRCRVAANGSLQSFAKLTGSQRQIGAIYPNDQLRQVFLGTVVLSDEARAMRYGADPERDVVGYVERIGPSRWRLVMPYPRFESLVDVLELVPAS